MTKVVLFYGCDEEFIRKEMDLLLNEMKRVPVTCSIGLSEDCEYSLIAVADTKEMDRYSEYTVIVLDYTNTCKDYDFPSIRMNRATVEEFARRHTMKQVLQVLSTM